MMMVRDAVMEDAERIREIYDYYVKNTAITFEYKTPSMEEFKERMERTMSRYPYLVIEEAYDWSCEMTVYLDHNAQRCGMGRAIYEALEAKLKKMGILNLYACIACPEIDDEYLTTNSADFHAYLGFVKAGEFRQCGYKFGRWYSMIWMEKIIGEHKDRQAPITDYPELKRA